MSRHRNHVVLDSNAEIKSDSQFDKFQPRKPCPVFSLREFAELYIARVPNVQVLPIEPQNLQFVFELQFLVPQSQHGDNDIASFYCNSVLALFYPTGEISESSQCYFPLSATN